MKKKLIGILTILLLILEVSAMNYYEIEIIKDKEDISYNSLQVKPFDKLNLSKLDTPNTFIIEIVDFDVKLIKRFFFDFNGKRSVESINPKTGLIESGELKVIDYTSELIILPYYENAKEINIYDQDFNKKLIIDVSNYAKKTSEKSEEKLKTEPKKQELVEKIPKTEKKPTNYVLFIIFGLIAVIISLIIIIVVIHSKKPEH